MESKLECLVIKHIEKEHRVTDRRRRRKPITDRKLLIRNPAVVVRKLCRTVKHKGDSRGKFYERVR